MGALSAFERLRQMLEDFTKVGNKLTSGQITVDQKESLTAEFAENAQRVFFSASLGVLCGSIPSVVTVNSRDVKRSFGKCAPKRSLGTREMSEVPDLVVSRDGDQRAAGSGRQGD